MVLEKLYEYIGTFEKGKLYAIVARLGMGKTVFAKRIEQELKLQGESVQYIHTLLDTHTEQISECEYIEYAKLMDIDSVDMHQKLPIRYCKIYHSVIQYMKRGNLYVHNTAKENGYYKYS